MCTATSYTANQTKKQQIAAEEQKQLSCLAKNIYHEAAGESFKGKLAVAQVTINRVKHDNFPDKVCDVVYQKTKNVCQFSWVCQGKNKIRSQDAYEESLLAARMVLKHNVAIDKLKNALYYHATYVNPGWDTRKRKVAIIGRHVFYEYRIKRQLHNNEKV